MFFLHYVLHSLVPNKMIKESLTKMSHYEEVLFGVGSVGVTQTLSLDLSYNLLCHQSDRIATRGTYYITVI